MSILLATSHLAGSAPLPVPERGFVSSQPAKTWEEGLICGNGTIGANALSRPLNERIIFTHERLFLPMGAPVMPPDQSARLFEIRRLIDRGLYKQATRTSVRSLRAGAASCIRTFSFRPSTSPSAAPGRARSATTAARWISRPARRPSTGPTTGASSSAACSSRARTAWRCWPHRPETRQPRLPARAGAAGTER